MWVCWHFNPKVILYVLTCFRIAATVNSDTVLLCECTCVLERQSMSAVWSQTKGLRVGGCVSSDCLYISVLVSDPRRVCAIQMVLRAERTCKVNVNQKHSKYYIFCDFVCVQHGLDVGPRQRALLLKGGSTDCSASRGTCTHPACCGESPNRSHSTSWMKTTLDRPEYDTHLLKENTIMAHDLLFSNFIWLILCFLISSLVVHAGKSRELEFWHFPLW